MSESILVSSILFVSSLPYSIKKVKFFGGEPLLKKSHIRYVVQNFPQKKTNFYVTTNSTLLDAEFIDFARGNNLKITLSIDGDEATTNENRISLSGKEYGKSIVGNARKFHRDIRVNQVITSKNSANFFRNFKFLYDLGVRNFNFLPEYYREWSKQGLLNLQKGFSEIGSFMQGKKDVYLVNAENYSETSFFNLGIVIDTDGSVYGTNLILAGVFERYKPALKIGDIYTGIRSDFHDESFQRKYVEQIQGYLGEHYPPPVLYSVGYVDRILSNFVLKYTVNQ